MSTLLHAAELEIQFRLNAEYVPNFANELTFLWPRFETWADVKGDSGWIAVICDHPKYPRANWFDPPRREVLVRYRLGRRHQWLLARNGREWALRRVALLMRMMLKKLSREVEVAA